MSSTAEDIWQVEVKGSIYEAPFAELGDWINGGSLLPDDKVRKGHLRWIEAGRVPALVPFFTAKNEGKQITVTVATPKVAAQEPASGPSTVLKTPSTENTAVSFTNIVNEAPKPGICLNHTDRASTLRCDGCGKEFCRECVSSYGGSAFVCKACGSMCRDLKSVVSAESRTKIENALSSEPFGFSDLGRAMTFPLKFKASLIFGTLMFCFFSFGQNVAAIGGIFMFVAALVCAMLANTLTFGVLSNTVDNFVRGELDQNFMPSFDDFSAWNDVIHPFFLSIAAYISAFLPFILTLLVGIYFVSSSVSFQSATYQDRLEKIPGTEVYKGRELAEQTGDVKGVLKDLQMKEKQRVDSLSNIGPGSNAGTLNQSPGEDTEAITNSLLNDKAVSPDVRSQPDAQAEWFKGALGLPAPLAIVSLITFLWGLVLFPASSAVAGYTRSFIAAINPFVAIDTVRHLGFRYVGLLMMLAVLLVGLVVIRMFAGLIFAPLAIPMFGNIPAGIIGNAAFFYLWIVFSCLIGYLLFKSAGRLKLTR